MRALIDKGGLRVDGADVPPSPQALNSVFGSFNREICFPLHGGGERIIRVFDDLGAAYYLDDRPPVIPSVLFVFSPEDAPFSLKTPFSGILQIDQTALTPDLTEKQLSTITSLRFAPQFGHKWCALSPHFSVWLNFRKRKNRLGRRTGAPKLVDVSICYDDPHPEAF